MVAFNPAFAICTADPVPDSSRHYFAETRIGRNDRRRGDHTRGGYSRVENSELLSVLETRRADSETKKKDNVKISIRNERAQLTRCLKYLSSKS